MALVVGFGSKLPPLAAEWCAHCRPHITICYSTSSQPAKPIIEALGTQLPRCDVDIDSLSLVVQHGPERDWDWSVVSTIRLE